MNNQEFPIYITLPIPISNNRYYRRSKWSTYISSDGLQYKQIVKYKLNNLNIKPTSDDLAIGITIHPKLTKKGIATKKILDLDNYDKCLLDSLKNIIFIDDKQIKRYDYKQYGQAVPDGCVVLYIRRFDKIEDYKSGINII